MLERARIICVVCLFAASLVPACQQEATDTGDQGETLPDVWQEIMREVNSIGAEQDQIIQAASPDSSEALERTYARRATAVGEIAGRHGRDGIVSLVEGYREIEHQLVKEDDGPPLGVVRAFASDVVVMIADPNDEHGLMSATTGGRGHFLGVAVIAIDLYRDEWARESLLRLVLQGDIVAGVLRVYPATDVRPKIETALAELESSRKGTAWEAQLAERRATAMRGLLASYDYAEGLDDATREQYRSFERRLWRSWALAPRGSRKIGAEFVYAAWAISDRWQEGDERFVLRIFEGPTSTLSELRIGTHLAHKLPPEGRQRLAEIAESDSTHAQYARQALERMADGPTPR